MDALEVVLGILAIATRWRLLLCIATSSVLAYGMFSLLPWMSGLQAIAFACFGAIPGVIWEDQSEGKWPTRQPTEQYVKVITWLFLGLGWGILSARDFHTFVFGAGIGVVSAFAYLRFATNSEATVAVKHLGASFASYSVAWWLAHPFMQ